MHFCVSAARGGLNGAFCCPRKIGTNWFMPALVNSRFGESGRRLDDGTMVCSLDLKKSRNDCRISLLVIKRQSIRSTAMQRQCKNLQPIPYRCLTAPYRSPTRNSASVHAGPYESY